MSVDNVVLNLKSYKIEKKNNLRKRKKINKIKEKAQKQRLKLRILSREYAMKISEHAITALQKVITGDPLGYGKEAIAPYRSGRELVNFFNQFGANDVYRSGFPSR